MSNARVALPPELHACVNEFLANANQLATTYKYDGVSASLLYAAARYNVHGFVQQGDAKWFSREEFITYMTDLYRRMLSEQVDLLADAATTAEGEGESP